MHASRTNSLSGVANIFELSRALSPARMKLFSPRKARDSPPAPQSNPQEIIQRDNVVMPAGPTLELSPSMQTRARSPVPRTCTQRNAVVNQAFSKPLESFNKQNSFAAMSSQVSDSFLPRHPSFSSEQQRQDQHTAALVEPIAAVAAKSADDGEVVLQLKRTILEQQQMIGRLQELLAEKTGQSMLSSSFAVAEGVRQREQPAPNEQHAIETKTDSEKQVEVLTGRIAALEAEKRQLAEGFDSQVQQMKQEHETVLAALRARIQTLEQQAQQTVVPGTGSVKKLPGVPIDVVDDATQSLDKADTAINLQLSESTDRSAIHEVQPQ